MRDLAANKMVTVRMPHIHINRTRCYVWWHRDTMWTTLRLRLKVISVS